MKGLLRDKLGAPIRCFPKDKPFVSYVRANGELLDLSQWRGVVSDRIGSYDFGPNAGPLRIPASMADKPCLEILQKEAQEMGWIVNLNIGDIGISLVIYHPEDPACSD